MFVFLFCDNNKDSTLVCSRFVNMYCTICSFWSTKVPVRNRKKKTVHTFVLRNWFQVRSHRRGRCPYRRMWNKVSIQNKCVVLFRPGYGNQNYTCFAHVTQGFICLILLLPSSDSSFHCHVAPSAGCTNGHSTDSSYKCRLTAGRDSIGWQGAFSRGRKNSSLANVNRKYNVKLNIYLHMLTSVALAIDKIFYLTCHIEVKMDWTI